MNKNPDSKCRVLSSDSLLRYASAVMLSDAAAVTLGVAPGAEPQQQVPFPEIIGVNTTYDATSGADDAFPGDGQCETAVGNGVCTLRAAIEESNAHGATDGIFISIPTSDPGYSNGTWTINLAKALPDLTDSVNINGPGADKLVVRNNGSFPMFNMTTSATVSFSRISIAHGEEDGLRCSSTGTVNVTDCTISGNYGGGILNFGSGTVNVTHCTLTGNGGGASPTAAHSTSRTALSPAILHRTSLPRHPRVGRRSAAEFLVMAPSR